MCTYAQQDISFWGDLKEETIILCDTALEDLLVLADPFDPQGWMGYVSCEVPELPVCLLPDMRRQLAGGRAMPALR